MKTVILIVTALAAATSASAQSYAVEYQRMLVLAAKGADVSHTLTLEAPSLTSSPTITLPAASLIFPLTNIGGVLTNDGSGNLSWTSAFSNPMNSPGDLIYGGPSGAMTRLAATTTADQVLLSGASGAPAWSSETFPASTTINQILYSSAGNTISGLATANYAVLNTDGNGVPSVTASPTISGTVQVGVPSGGSNPATGVIAFANASSTNVTGLRAGNASAAVTYTLPTADAAVAGQSLTSDGSGTLSWNTTGISEIAGESGGNFSDGNFAFPLGQGQNPSPTLTLESQMIVTRAGTFKNLYVQVATAPPGGKDYEIVVIKNGSATTLAADITSGTTSASDLTDAVSVAAGDLISVQMTHITSAAPNKSAIWTFELTYP